MKAVVPAVAYTAEGVFGGGVGQYRPALRWTFEGHLSFFALLHFRRVFYEHQGFCEGTRGHVFHFKPPLVTRYARVKGLLHFPQHHTDCQKQEKAGKKHGEEHKQIYMILILAEKYDAARVVAGLISIADTLENQIESGSLQIVYVIG